MARRHVNSMTDIRSELAALDLDKVKVEGPWSVAQVLAHCAQSMEYALIGFPLNKSRLFQVTVGQIALTKFLRQGYMSHDTTGAIPGAPPPANKPMHEARARLLAAIDKFEAHDGPFAPHFAYGTVDKSRYSRVQAMHIAEHLEHFKT